MTAQWRVAGDANDSDTELVVSVVTIEIVNTI